MFRLHEVIIRHWDCFFWHYYLKKGLLFKTVTKTTHQVWAWILPSHCLCKSRVQSEEKGRRQWTLCHFLRHMQTAQAADVAAQWGQTISWACNHTRHPANISHTANTLLLRTFQHSMFCLYKKVWKTTGDCDLKLLKKSINSLYRL